MLATGREDALSYCHRIQEQIRRHAFEEKRVALNLESKQRGVFCSLLFPALYNCMRMSSLRFLVPRIPRPIIRSALRAHRGVPSREASRTLSTVSPSQLPKKPDTSLSGRLRDLSRRYGRAAIGVYFGISVIDYLVAFGLVHQLGAERIGDYEDRFFNLVKHYTGWHKQSNSVQDAADSMVVDTANKLESIATPDQSGDLDDKKSSNQPKKGGLWTEAVIAYGIHKALFIFIRVPITVAITPSIVKSLVKRGWKIGPAAASVEATKSISKP